MKIQYSVYRVTKATGKLAHIGDYYGSEKAQMDAIKSLSGKTTAYGLIEVNIIRSGKPSELKLAEVVEYKGDGIYRFYNAIHKGIANDYSTKKEDWVRFSDSTRFGWIKLKKLLGHSFTF